VDEWLIDLIRGAQRRAEMNVPPSAQPHASLESASTKTSVRSATHRDIAMTLARPPARRVTADTDKARTQL